jgi:hypothetical protein
VTYEGLAQVLLAGAVELDRYNPCGQHGSESGEPCLDDDDRPVRCVARVQGDPILAHALRGMARECKRLTARPNEG